MKFTIGLLISQAVILAVVLLTQAQDPDPNLSKVVAFLNGAATLSCPEHTEGDHVAWKDKVWNTAREPIVIWDSRTGQNSAHGNTAAHSVDSSTQDLTISRLTNDDAGLYMCEVEKEDGTSSSVQKYDLTIISKPECTGNGDTTEGNIIPLECVWQFSGQGYPDVSWKNNRGTVESTDESTIFEGKKTTKVTASYLDDGVSYRCVMAVRSQGKIMEEVCEVPFRVTYAARNLTVEPDLDFYAPGQTITFSALGNPKPDLTLDPAGKVNDDGSISVEVTEDMLDKNFTFTFSAENSLSAEPATFSKSFKVMSTKTTEPTTTTPAPTTPSGGDGAETPKDKNKDKDLVVIKTGEKSGTATKKGGVPVAIIGAVVGVVVLIILIVLIVIIVRRKKSTKPKGAQPVPTSEEKYRQINPEQGEMNGKGQVGYPANEKQPLNGNHKTDDEEIWQKRNSFR